MRRTQRAKIYSTIAEKIANEIKDSFAVCLELDEALKRNNINDWLGLSNYFPEFSLFEPPRLVNGNMWWTNGKVGNNRRILALLLSEQIALNP